MLEISNATHMRLKILTAVEELIKDKHFAKLTVREICAKAGISSPTFYKYFADKYQIAEWLFDCIFDKWIMQIGRTLTWRQGYLMHTKSLQSCSHIFKEFMEKPAGRQSLPAYGRRRQRQALQETITEYKHVELTEELLFQIDCLVQLETRTAVDWIQDDRLTPERYVDLLVDVIPRKLYKLLEKPVHPVEELTGSALGGIADGERLGFTVEQLLTNDTAILVKCGI